MKVAVTGGSGVVGAVIVRHLVEAGYDVRALARSPESSAKLSRLGASVVHGDLLDDTATSRIVKGCERVFHVAGVNEMCSRDPQRMWRVNVEGTLQTLRASARAGVARFIHTSSAATLGEATGTVGFESSKHRGYFLSDYERSKTVAERLAFDSVADIEVVSVNPSSVQGPGRASGTGGLLMAAALGKLPVLVDATFSMVDIDDCARGHLLAADVGVPGQRYVLSGSVLTVREVVGTLRRLAGKTRPPIYLKPRAVSALAPVVDRSLTVLGKTSPLCSESARVLLHGHRYDGSRASRDLGLEYTPAESTLERALHWYREEVS